MLKFLRHILLVFAAFLVLFNSVSLTVLRVNYDINKASIAASLCEKKEVKQNDCQGQCHLKKQIRQSEKNKAGIPGIENAMTEYAGNAHAINYPEKLYTHMRVAHNFAPQFLIACFTPGDIFHPPGNHFFIS